jgi:hypothetical protein
MERIQSCFYTLDLRHNGISRCEARVKDISDHVYASPLISNAHALGTGRKHWHSDTARRSGGGIGL